MAQLSASLRRPQFGKLELARTCPDLGHECRRIEQPRASLNNLFRRITRSCEPGA
jgi:hypothetical protein